MNVHFQLDLPRKRWNDNIKIDVSNICCGNVKWLESSDILLRWQWRTFDSINVAEFRKALCHELFGWFVGGLVTPQSLSWSIKWSRHEIFNQNSIYICFPSACYMSAILILYFCEYSVHREKPLKISFCNFIFLLCLCTYIYCCSSELFLSFSPCRVCWYSLSANSPLLIMTNTHSQHGWTALAGLSVLCLFYHCQHLPCIDYSEPRR